MKFTIEDALVQQTGKGQKARMTLILSQYDGDKSVDANDAKLLNLKGKIIETEELITDENVIVSYSNKELIYFLSCREDLYVEKDFEWDDTIKMFTMGNYLFPNQIKEDSFTIRSIKEMIEKSRNK